MKNNIFDKIQKKVDESGLLRPIDILIVGATGSGKSSTINSIFGSEIAKVGEGVYPETQNISDYKLSDYLRFHDSAGLGDGKENDLNHNKNITEKLLQKLGGDQKEYFFIDMVLVILEGGLRDLGTSFKLLENTILKSISPSRVVVAINQCDMAMKGRYWNKYERKPEKELEDFLNEKSISTKNRIKEATGFNIDRPVYFSALNNFNIDKLIEHIYHHIPSSRRRKFDD
ncbi:GTPase family protein [Comamonas sp. C11]|uniref:GTPase family protein n=1 Tax=Comamonas sp. C11 TaxID=2966554 RepID=UPI002111B3C6|nr:GTPase [Comamonas sp. C11]UUC96747.1 50S ribosome-binding GTPase [Comamonas sp. C11]